MVDGEYCILREEIVRERRGSYSGFCCRLYPFICWIIIKEGPDNFSVGGSPHWVNHVNLCLSCIVYLLCFVFCICFILLLLGPVFLTRCSYIIQSVFTTIGSHLHHSGSPSRIIPYLGIHGIQLPFRNFMHKRDNKNIS
jgi:hypothetical protein